MAVLFQQFLFQRAAIDADANGNVLFLAHIHNGLDPILATNVAGIDANFCRTALCSRNGKTVIKMNVCHQGQRRGRCNLCKALCPIHIRNSQANNLTAGSPKPLDLLQRAFHIGGFCI